MTVVRQVNGRSSRGRRTLPTPAAHGTKRGTRSHKKRPPPPAKVTGAGRGGLSPGKAEAEGLEPPCACARRISSAVPYQLGLRLHVRMDGVATSTDGVGLISGRLRRPRSSPSAVADSGSNPLRTHPRPLRYLSLTDGVGFEPTRALPTRFPIVRLKPLGHPSLSLQSGRPDSNRGPLRPERSALPD